MTGGMKFTSHINSKRPEQVLAAIMKGIDWGAKRVEKRALQKVPVDTGKLKRSISIKNIEGGKSIGPDTDYDIYVEMGTSRMGAQPYMRPAMDENRKLIAEFTTKRIRGALK